MTYMVMCLPTCEEPFTPDLSDIKSENELVVEGFITNGEGPHQITLSRTVAPDFLDRTTLPVESGAVVQVVDRDGNVHTLNETEPGVYSTDEAEFQARLGNAYQLKIELSNGEKFESDFQELIPVPPIDTLYHRRGTTEQVVDQVLRVREVVQILTDYSAHEETAYYRYEYDGTHAFNAQLQGSSSCWDVFESPPEDLSSETICYLNQNQRLPLNVSAFPDPLNAPTGTANIFNLNFDIRFSLGFSMLVRKYALTKGYHDYLASVREQSEFRGSIFDSPPTQIIGNIRNVNNPDRFALGYFSTLAQTTKRIFIPSLGFRRDPGLCTGDAFPTDCCDCRLTQGAYTEKPDFWP